MKKRWIIPIGVTFAGLIVLVGNCQQPSSLAPSPSRITPGTLAQVEMSSGIDAKKAHAGDVFHTRLWDAVRGGDGQIVLPRKTIIVGHVVESHPLTKENSESKLTIAFDKAVLKNGSELALDAVVERVQISSIALAAADTNQASYSQGLNPGSTTNVAMPASVPPAKDSGQSPTPGPTNVRDTTIVAQPDASGMLTVLTSADKKEVQLKKFATLDLRIKHVGQ